VTNAPTSACHFYWINSSGEVRNLNADIIKNDALLFMHQLCIEMDSEWIQKYKNQYNFERSNSNASLKNLLADFFREEPLDGDYYCSKCLDLKKARQKADLALPLPRILIIQLKRFTYDTYSDAKIDTYIDFPLRDLDLSQYVIQNAEKNTNVSALYDLVAVSNHTGTLVSGHYTTYARNDRNKTWYSFNDEITRKIIDEKNIVTKNAYILVYVKRSVQ
jgi:ubiquitin C-terminal hydrolase